MRGEPPACWSECSISRGTGSLESEWHRTIEPDRSFLERRTTMLAHAGLDQPQCLIVHVQVVGGSFQQVRVRCDLHAVTMEEITRRGAKCLLPRLRQVCRVDESGADGYVRELVSLADQKRSGPHLLPQHEAAPWQADHLCKQSR